MEHFVLTSSTQIKFHKYKLSGSDYNHDVLRCLLVALGLAIFLPKPLGFPLVDRFPSSLQLVNIAEDTLYQAAV